MYIELQSTGATVAFVLDFMALYHWHTCTFMKLDCVYVCMICICTVDPNFIVQRSLLNYIRKKLV